MPLRYYFIAVGVVVIAVFAMVSVAPAEQFTFTVDPIASSIRASGQIPLAGVDAVPQAPGSDLTTYSGDVLVDLDDLAAPTAIEFLEGTITAADSGDWLPDTDGGSVGGPSFGDADPGVAAPANYGLFAEASLGTLWLALRDIVISPISDPLAINNGAFASTLVVNTTQGWSDYNFNAASILFGDRAVSDSMEGVVGENMAGDGLYEVDAGVATITIPIDILFVIVDDGTGFTVFELSYSGTIVATRSIVSALAGDFDEDGDVDGDDFLAWQGGFGTPTGASHADGDGDGDGDVDGDDFLVWQGQFGSVTGGSGAELPSIPEPATWILALLLIAVPCAAAASRRSPRAYAIGRPRGL